MIRPAASAGIIPAATQAFPPMVAFIVSPPSVVGVDPGANSTVFFIPSANFFGSVWLLQDDKKKRSRKRVSSCLIFAVLANLHPIDPPMNSQSPNDLLNR